MLQRPGSHCLVRPSVGYLIFLNLFLGQKEGRLKINNMSFVWQILCSYVVDVDHLADTSITSSSMNCFVNLESSFDRP